MVQFRRSRFRLASIVAVGVLLLVSCGGGEGSNAKPALDSGQRPNLPVDTVSANGPLPHVTVRDLTQNRWVQFANFLPADKPVLIWFWAPH